MAEAIDEMIVDETHRLHRGIDDGRADEIETFGFQILGEFLRDLQTASVSQNPMRMDSLCPELIF